MKIFFSFFVLCFYNFTTKYYSNKNCRVMTYSFASLRFHQLYSIVFTASHLQLRNVIVDTRCKTFGGYSILTWNFDIYKSTLLSGKPAYVHFFLRWFFDICCVVSVDFRSFFWSRVIRRLFEVQCLVKFVLVKTWWFYSGRLRSDNAQVVVCLMQQVVCSAFLL